ncbi:MAG: response regulator [Candidatus Harrisonbacteria bacterium]|nr:response regulator [Candidatus Harrisonbacteria bacterium]MBI2406172.1 response regulator [Candidatus Harrisonbacteria bacterium]MBI2604303.1 response regulator [Candidatus Harrisonbacteria bacterium]
MANATKKKILIVEDEHPLANALEFKFKSAGFEVGVAYDGDEGIEKMKNSAYDLVLLDLVMPKKDGFAVLQEMRDAGLGAAVIALTNLSQREDLDRVKALGVIDYLVKSDVALNDVVARVREFFASKKMAVAA